MDRGTLRGLKAVKVVVDAATPDMERIGLTQDHLRTDIEEKLRGAGININNDAQEFLGLGISTSPARRGPGTGSKRIRDHAGRPRGEFLSSKARSRCRSPCATCSFHHLAIWQCCARNGVYGLARAALPTAELRPARPMCPGLQGRVRQSAHHRR